MSTLKVNSIIPVAGVPTGGGGGIIQIKQTVKKDTFSQSSLNDSTFSNDTGLNVTITPTSTSSKIRITGSVVISMDQDDDGYGIGLFKDGSVITDALGDADGNRTRCMNMTFAQNFGGEARTLPIDFIDSPSTTSAITYGVRIIFFSGTASSTVYLNRSQSDDNNVFRPRSISTITAMEVSA
tara:strand:- start:312 stop:857 length:546 start_codon:yes stop_codon:yes gene_type:complete